MLNQKAALELTTSFIVGMIIGIVLLILGLSFALNLLNASDRILTSGMPDTIKQEVQICISNSEKVCLVSASAKTIRKGAYDRFWIVTNNIVGSRKTYKPFIRLSTYQLKNGGTTTVDESKWFSSLRTVTLENNEQYTYQVAAHVPDGTLSGTYVFNINVCFDDTSNPDASKCTSPYVSLYSPTQQITITVP